MTEQPPQSEHLKTILNSAWLLVGDTGTGKTSLLADLALFVWERFRKVSRYYVWDPGGYPDRMAALVDQGIVEVWRVRGRDPDGSGGMPLGTITKATRGFWPAAFIDPMVGHAPSGVELISPTTDLYRMLCGKCGASVTELPTQQLPGGGQACGQCGQVNTPTDVGEVQRVTVLRKEFAHIGAYLFDGLTSMAEWAITDLNFRAGHDMLGGEKGAINTLSSDGLIYGSSGRGGVGFVQNRGYEWVQNSLGILGAVVPPVFTALEDKGTDSGNAIVYGPKLIGRARTADIPSWFGATLGIAEVGTERRLYTRRYVVPPDPVHHLAKVRCQDGLLPEYLSDGAGKAFSGFSLGELYRHVETALKKAQEEIAERVGDPAAEIAKMKAEAKATPLLTEKASLTRAATATTLPTAAGRPGPPVAVPRAASPAPVAAAPVALPAALPTAARPTPRPVTGQAPGAPPAVPPVSAKP